MPFKDLLWNSFQALTPSVHLVCHALKSDQAESRGQAHSATDCLAIALQFLSAVFVCSFFLCVFLVKVQAASGEEGESSARGQVLQ